jgi:hypothetical protein
MKTQEEVEYFNHDIKGMVICKAQDGAVNDTIKFLGSVHCKILKIHQDRVLIQAKRRELLMLKEYWLNHDKNSQSSETLSRCIANIIISGK